VFRFIVEKGDQHNTGSPVYERIGRVIVECAPQSDDRMRSLSEPTGATSRNEVPTEVGREISYEEPPALKSTNNWPHRHWSD